MDDKGRRGDDTRAGGSTRGPERGERARSGSKTGGGDGNLWAGWRVMFPLVRFVLFSPFSGQQLRFQNYFQKMNWIRKTQNTNLAQNFKIYNFVNINIFKFRLVFEIQFEFEKGTNLGFKPNSKLLLILYGNLKTFEYQSYSLWQALKLCQNNKLQILNNFLITLKGVN